MCRLENKMKYIILIHSVWSIILIIFACDAFADNVFPSEDELLRRLFDGYDLDARPTIEAVPVEIGFYLDKLDDVDSKHQILYTVGYLHMKWNDRRLKWNSTEYGGIDLVVVSPERIWIPDIGLSNAYKVGAMHDEKRRKYMRVSVTNTGVVNWFPGGTYASSCTVDIKFFPFDEQVCHLTFSSWVYSNKELNVTMPSDKIVISDSHPENVEWTIVDTYATMISKNYSCCQEKYSRADFRIHLRRKPLYFIILVVVPAIFLSMMVVMVFFLPAESGEKISLGITTLLAYTVFMFMIAERLPRSSDAVPLIGAYLTCFMATSTLAVVLSIIILHFHHHSGGHPPPQWMKTLICGYIEKTVQCLNHNEIEFHHSNADPYRTIGKETRQSELELDERSGKEKEDNNITFSNTKIAKLVKTVEEINKRQILAEKEQNVAEEWKHISTVLDHFFFFVFLSILVIFTALILGVIPLLQPTIDLRKI